MRALRVAVRLIGLSLLTLSQFLLWVGVLPFVVRFPATADRWRHFNFGLWSRGVLRLVGARLRIRGTPPEPPFFLVSNHLSYLDIVVLASCLDAVFVAKAEIGRWPIVGFLCRCMQIIFIDRSSRRDIPRVLVLIDSALQRHQGIVVFPEGTSSDGSTVGSFRPSLLETAARTGRPVSYASLSYDTPEGEDPAHLAICWWGDMPFLSHLLKLLALRRFRITLVFGEERIQDGDRKRLAERLREAVAGQFIPVVDREMEKEWVAH